VDTVLLTLPSKFLLERVLVVLNTTLAGLAGVTSTVSLGHASGGQEILTDFVIDPTVDPTTAAAVWGSQTAELGADFPVGHNWSALYPSGTGQDVHLTVVNAVNPGTAGDITVILAGNVLLP
jgi:hypothetical protein